MILGSRLWYPFHASAVDTDEKFLLQIDALVREIGDRGKPKLKARPSEGVPP